MPDGSVCRGGNDPPTDSPSADGNSDDPVPNYGRWVTFYGYVHRSVRYRSVLFGGLAVVGVFAVVRHVAALVTEGVSVFSTLAVLGGVFLFVFGIGYSVVRYSTSCRECGADFSKERVGKQLTHREPDGRTQTVQTIKCLNCGDRTTLTCAQTEQETSRW